MTSVTRGDSVLTYSIGGGFLPFWLCCSPGAFRRQFRLYFLRSYRGDLRGIPTLSRNLPIAVLPNDYRERQPHPISDLHYMRETLYPPLLGVLIRPVIDSCTSGPVSLGEKHLPRGYFSNLELGGTYENVFFYRHKRNHA